MCEPGRFLDLLRHCAAFGETGGGLIKIIASAKDQPPGDHKAGVIRPTQGSGKSPLMALYAGLLVFDTRMANPRLVVLTDCNDLDDQLFAIFAM